MKKRYVINPLDLQTRSPLILLAVVTLLIDRFAPSTPGWVWGVLGTLAFFITAGWIKARLEEETLPRKTDP